MQLRKNVTRFVPNLSRGQRPNITHFCDFVNRWALAQRREGFLWSLIVRPGLDPTGHRFGLLDKGIAKQTDPPRFAYTPFGGVSNAGRGQGEAVTLEHQSRVTGGRAPT